MTLIAASNFAQQLRTAAPATPTSATVMAFLDGLR